MSFIVAIVGRPNVGKSTLFNRIIGKRISIVDDKPGVTRDRIYGNTQWNGKEFTIVDTGGIEPMAKDVILSQMKRQADFAIETADLIIFMVDGKEGVTPIDQDVADYLRKSGKPVVLAVNKIDNYENEAQSYEFYELGFGDPVLISAVHGLGTGDLLDKVTEFIKEPVINGEEEDVIKIAIIGKPNVGKSSIVNAILGQERVIVSDIPGTTRDAIDTYYEANGKKMVLIDTAGLRKKSKINEDIEYYSSLRAMRAIDRADVALIVLDATCEISEQDKRIAGIAHESGKASIIIVNKWDLVNKDTHTVNEYNKKIKDSFAFMQYAPIIYVSAKTGQRIKRILELINIVMDNYTLQIKTSVLNELIREAIAISEPPSIKGKKLKIYYVTQAGTKPPAFNLFVNDPELLHFSYMRYIENTLRKAFGFVGSPLIIRPRKSRGVK